MTPEDAEEYTQALGQVMAGGWRQIALGRRLGVPTALGLTVQQWVDDRLGGYVRLSLQERKEAAKELTKPVEEGGEGLSVRKAAEVVGLSPATVWRATDPVSNETPEPEMPGKETTDPVSNETPEPERREPKSHAVAHEERKEASRQEQEAALSLPDLADLGLDRIEYGTSALAYLVGRDPKIAQVCITSPPYWKKRTYVPGDPMELGQEPKQSERGAQSDPRRQ